MHDDFYKGLDPHIEQLQQQTNVSLTALMSCTQLLLAISNAALMSCMQMAVSDRISSSNAALMSCMQVVQRQSLQ